MALAMHEINQIEEFYKDLGPALRSRLIEAGDHLAELESTLLAMDQPEAAVRIRRALAVLIGAERKE
jgi:hypothetical protein